MIIRACRKAAILLWLAVMMPAVATAATDGPMEIEVDKGDLVRLPRPAASVFVANPEIADIHVMSPSLVYVFGRRTGETTVYAVDDREQTLVDRRVIVTHNLTGLQTALARSLPDSKVNVQTVQSSIVLSGEVASPTQAENARRLAARYVGEGGEVINQLAVAGPTQIHLRVRVAEVSRTVTKQFGINWESIGEFGNFVIGLGIGPDFVNAAGAIVRTPNVNNLSLSFQSGSLDINTLVDALAENGMITVLAEPNLTALSGETASFLAGGEFPIPVATDDNVIKVEYKEFGVSLAFRPTLMGADRINLRVRPEVSQLSSAGAVTLDSLQIPALTTRRAETTVELASGQSFAIAGLLQNNTNQNISKFPMLGDLPVLGALFRSTEFQRDESELVIIVTPYLVQPTTMAKLATPVDGFVPPNDRERVLYGRLQGKAPEDGAAGSAPRKDGSAPRSDTVGFMFE